MDKNLLRENITDYGRLDPVRMHVPSHKGIGSDENLSYSMDVTELSFSDNLLHPTGVIAKAQDDCADIFGVKKSFFTVNGATSAVMAGIMSCVRENEKLLLPDNSHISAYYGAAYVGADVVRLPLADSIANVTVDEIEKSLQLHPDIRAVFLTNPTYYGCTADIEAIAEYVSGRGIFLIVDESHGSHFHFSEEYPVSAVDTKADIVIHSAHKSMNALTQTAIIHLVSDRISPFCIKRSLRLIHTTSPSYLLMNSLIDSVYALKDCGNVLHNEKIWYNKLLNKLQKKNVFSLRNHDKLVNHKTKAVDYMKIPVYLRKDCISGYELADILEREFAIYAEMADEDSVLLYAGLNTSQNDHQRILSALLSLQPRLDGGDYRRDIPVCIKTPQRVMSIRRAFMSDVEEIDADSAVNRVSADFISIYPPGTPMITPGEKIEYCHIQRIADVPERNVSGVEKGKIKVIRNHAG